MTWASIVAGFLKLANTAAAYFKTKQDQDAGRAMQKSDQDTADRKADQNATVIRERNAALSHDELADKLRRQTGVEP